MALVQAGVKSSMIDMFLGRAPLASVLLARCLQLELAQGVLYMHLSCSLSIMLTAVYMYNATGQDSHFTFLPLHAARSSATSTCASISLIEVQVNEGLSDSPADLLDFSMKQELEQVGHLLFHLGMHSFQCCPFLICSKPCSCLDVH